MPEAFNNTQAGGPVWFAGDISLKLIIQVPCFNEEDTLAETLACLPRTVEGFKSVEWLVVNDGSKDRTVEVAKECGVDHIVDFPANRGLAKAFVAGIHRALEEGADVIVNTDADNQYNADDIPKLVGTDRRTPRQYGGRQPPHSQHRTFFADEKAPATLGSWVVRFTSGANVLDAPSGFRAISREASMRLNIFDSSTYTLESIIQAGRSGVSILPYRSASMVKPDPRGWYAAFRAMSCAPVFSIVRSMFVYRPGQTFFLLGLVPLIIGVFLSIRWLLFYFEDRRAATFRA